MTKEDAVERLKAKGYEAYVLDGIVMVISEEAGMKETIKSCLADIGYNASFGVTNVLKKKDVRV